VFGARLRPGAAALIVSCHFTHSLFMTILPYNPGVLPTVSAPSKGEWIVIKVEGLPPYKEIRRSIRNTKHPRSDSFVALRTEPPHELWRDGRCISTPLGLI
jgi:hypothetical protein